MYRVAAWIMDQEHEGKKHPDPGAIALQEMVAVT